MTWFENVVSMDGKLQGQRRTNRQIMFIISAITAPIEMFFTLTGMSKIPPLMTPFYFSAITVNLTVLAMCLFRGPLPDTALKGYIVLGFLNTIALDLNMRTLSQEPVWPLLVLLADLALTLRLGRRFASYLIVGTTFWILITAAESIARFGLFDAPGTDGWEVRTRYMQGRCSCDSPPCERKLSVALQEMSFSVLVLVADFIATRSFAESAEKEQATMARTISTIERVAVLLAAYDVDTVAQMLEAADLPVAMHSALHQLEQNLRVYRPYLPRSCLPLAEDAALDRECLGDTDTEVHSISCTHSESSAALSIPNPLAMTRHLWEMREVRASVMVVNVRDTLESLAEDAHRYAMQFGSLLEITQAEVEHRRGVVDVFVGDRILASFNALRPCAVHATAATHATVAIITAENTAGAPAKPDTAPPPPLKISIGLASGRALCGDMGCLSARRFSVLGGVARSANGMEYAARALGVTVLCNALIRTEADLEHTLLLLPRTVRICKASGPTDEPAERVYELVTEAKASGRKGDEWLYEIGQGAAEWADYNSAMQAYRIRKYYGT